MGVLSSIGKAVRMVASATIGLPVALAASAVLLPTALLLRGMEKCWSEIFKSRFDQYTYLKDIGLIIKAGADGAYSLFTGMWMGFGLYAGVKGMEAVDNSFGRAADYLGFQNHDQHYPEIVQDNTNPSNAEKQAKDASERAQNEETYKKLRENRVKRHGKKYEIENSMGAPLINPSATPLLSRERGR